LSSPSFSFIELGEKNGDKDEWVVEPWELGGEEGKEERAESMYTPLPPIRSSIVSDGSEAGNLDQTWCYGCYLTYQK
jgi:hypothetical protein